MDAIGLPVFHGRGGELIRKIRLARLLSPGLKTDDPDTNTPVSLLLFHWTLLPFELLLQSFPFSCIAYASSIKKGCSCSRKYRRMHHIGRDDVQLTGPPVQDHWHPASYGLCTGDGVLPPRDGQDRDHVQRCCGREAADGDIVAPGIKCKLPHLCFLNKMN